MRLKIIPVWVMLVGIMILNACGGNTPKQAANDTRTGTEVMASSEPETMETASSDEVPEKYALGKKIYDEKCVVCHQADGTGMVGAFPPLKHSDYLLENPIRGIEQTLNGSFEEMVVNGVTYNAPMTPQVDTKEEALAVINYVLKYFNDSNVELTMDDIKDVEIKPRDE